MFAAKCNTNAGGGGRVPSPWRNLPCINVWWLHEIGIQNWLPNNLVEEVGEKLNNCRVRATN